MTFCNINKLNIYAIPIGDFWNITPDRIFILYAPLSGQYSLVSKNKIVEIENCISGKSKNEKIEHLIEKMSKVANLPFFKMQYDHEKLFQIDILANYTCNFKCIYCYSAEGRSNKTVEWSSVKALLDYLFCSNKKQTRPYVIHFSGGGEPLLSFDIIKKSVAYIENVCGNYKYTLGMVSNGSLLTPSIADYLKEHKIDLAISFEILKELQDSERGQYDKVASNIDMLLEKDVKFGIRTTFTHDSVMRMSEMITELHNRFPQIKNVVFDTVLSPNLFNSPEELNSYYRDYINEYYKAKKYGKTLGIDVDSIATETMSILRDRTCEGKIVLTPMGTISACSRISSPSETLYNDNIYGEVKDGVLYFDKTKFQNIMAENNIYTQEYCNDCFAKWNCGGGCRLFHKSFTPDFLVPKCNFTREGLRIQLYNCLIDNFQKSTGKNLWDVISIKIKNNEL